MTRPIIGQPFDRASITAIFRAISEELPPGPQVEITIIGGAYMALIGARQSTVDIDSASAIPEELASAAKRALANLDLSPATFNANAVPFVSGADTVGGRVLLCEQGRLKVFGPAPNTMLLLKLRAARPQRDMIDIIHLFPLCDFTSVTEIMRSFEEAFPEEAHDPHLREFVRQLAQRAGMDLTD